jgi:ABC-type multidrug transport system ATPase subunit
MNAVELKNVVKRYGRQLALDGLSMTMPKGSICALIGPNGCGKTTTMGVIAGLLHIETGSVNLLGEGAFDPQKHAGRVSLMPQDAVPSGHVPIIDSLRYYAELSGMDRTQARREAYACLEKVQLKDRAHSRFGQLSHGMRRRFSVAQALLGKPELILLDEPTSGLDPELVVQIRDVIAAQRRETTMLISSHILSELETMCDHAIFVERGKVVRQGSMEELTSANSVVRYTLSSDPNLPVLELALQGCSLEWRKPVLTVRAPQSQPVEQTNALCLSALLEQKAGIYEVDAGHSLEAAYMELKRGQ